LGGEGDQMWRSFYKVIFRFRNYEYYVIRSQPNCIIHVCPLSTTVDFCTDFLIVMFTLEI
jgi:hypothetical protein